MFILCLDCSMDASLSEIPGLCKKVLTKKPEDSEWPLDAWLSHSYLILEERKDYWLVQEGSDIKEILLLED